MMDVFTQEHVVADDPLALSDRLLGSLEELNLREIEHPPYPLRSRALRVMALSGALPATTTVQGLIDGLFDAQLWILAMRRGRSRGAA